MKFSLPWKKEDETSTIDLVNNEITSLLEVLGSTAPDTEEYDTVSNRLSELIKIKSDLQNNPKKISIDSNIAAAIITSVSGVLATWLIIKYERDGGLFTSSAKEISKRLL